MIMAEFHQICLAQEYISQGGITYAREILEKALGSQKALEVINRLTATLQVRPFDFARKADPNQILNFIQNESPQTIALVLSYLQFEQAAAILSSLPQEKQADVARRVAVMDSTSPRLSLRWNVLEQKLSSTVTQDYTNAGGIESIVQILNGVDRGTERTILDSLEIQDPELAEEIKTHVCIRRYCQRGRSFHSTYHPRYRQRRLAACTQSGERRSSRCSVPQHVQTDVRDIQGRNGIHGTCSVA